jgi:hypothetical protein
MWCASMSKTCGFWSEDPEEVILDQLAEGESFWLKGEVWQVLERQGKLVLCQRAGHDDRAALDASVVVTPRIEIGSTPS